VQAIVYLFDYSFIIIFTLVAASAPPPLPSIDDILPQFKIGDRVCTYITPGCHPIQFVKDFGSVAELKYE